MERRSEITSAEVGVGSTQHKVRLAIISLKSLELILDLRGDLQHTMNDLQVLVLFGELLSQDSQDVIDLRHGPAIQAWGHIMIGQIMRYEKCERADS